MAMSFQGFRCLIENNPDAISLIDADGEILYENASATTLFGYQPEGLLGRNCLDLVHSEDRAHSSRALRNVLTKPPGPFQWDARVRHRDGNYSWVENTVSNLLFEGEVQALLMHQRDIQARRAAEAERHQHAGEITNGNLRVEEFACTAAQDLRHPLEAISAFAERLMGQAEIDENAKQTARLILDGVARMSALVDDLLGIAKTSGATATGRPLPAVLVNEIHLVRFRRNLTSKAVKQRDEPRLKSR